ncbi:MAG: exodeoxyribonuclease VII large subunit [Firmicutes bacterium]|nr:exodeoxyribonuclease VII large subunit [Bacillota bacterium]
MKRPMVLTVSQLTTYLRALLEGDENLNELYLNGEISNFKAHSASGHFYFDLKDDRSVIHAVMFCRQAARLRFRPEDGMCVLARGHVSLYEKSGQYQFYCDDLQPDGAGALAVAFEQLRTKLQREGLFDPARKRAIPACPMRVGIITSPTGAALQDMLHVTARRFPLAKIVFAPVLVQGAGAAEQIAQAVRRMNEQQAADVLIVGRGGGSAEDLWAFNEEPVVRAVASSRIPVISAVGHETDTTLCDYAADLRAPTPSAAAECAVPEKEALLLRLAGWRGAMENAISAQLEQCERRWKAAASRRCLSVPQMLYENHRIRLDELTRRMSDSSRRLLEQKGIRFSSACAHLNALSPLAVISRGYAMVEKDGAVQNSAAGLLPGDRITVRMRDGALRCRVTERPEKECE